MLETPQVVIEQLWLKQWQAFDFSRDLEVLDWNGFVQGYVC